jgi:hypothetical protein
MWYLFVYTLMHPYPANLPAYEWKKTPVAPYESPEACLVDAVKKNADQLFLDNNQPYYACDIVEK